jgi:alkyl sulfatase BDS1-like metallo-beta-lactamase superfamily hydrolase
VTDERDDQGRNAATSETSAALAEFAATLPDDDGLDFERVDRGFIASLTDPVIPNTSAASQWQPVTWDISSWAFVEGDPPPTVNPSLWRHAKLGARHGLFKVVDGVYQVRGHDTSVVTFIEGETGWVIVDPLTTTETAQATMGLVNEHLGERPVKAVLYTHSHVDHYGGILGMVDRASIDAGEVEIIAPEGFLEAAVSENVAAGPAMGRRATYQYGMLLPSDERGHVDQGVGKAVPVGTIAMVPPTVHVTETGQEMVLDGVRIEFQITPDSEAPAEMHFFFPDHKVLCLAENCTGTIHNVYTLRGTVIRDALQWSRYIDEAIQRFGDRLEVSIASHHWPHWGREDVVDYMSRQRDLYRWIHDEAMRLANLGHTPNEIAAEVELPAGLWEDWSCHGYYGTVSHNVRGVYQRYLGYYDGHPSSLNPYPAGEAAERYVSFMGGMDSMISQARRSYDEGDYRWVAEVMRHAVFAEPANQEARSLQADAFEQLGYQAESAPWRDVYLMGAQELRQGTMDLPAFARPRPEAASGMTLEQIFDYFAVCLDGPAALELGHVEFRWVLTDSNEEVGLTLSNGTLHSGVGRPTSDPVATVRSTRAVLDDVVVNGGSLVARVESSGLAIEGDAGAIGGIWDLMVEFPLFFPIIEP